ncbi:MAG: bifunctional aspartate kinase/homoserine dehydrogenase I [Candidatus Azobacteroides sp.]|nr:bifunctional aspartate kinase/homoserine dehydrogenase I [Candidatus Azobacteroides sp.]
MKVLKFGGTSVGSANSLSNVKKIVESCNEPVIIVVSALGGITDKLIEASRLASLGDTSYEKILLEMVNRHLDIIEEMVPEKDKNDLMEEVTALFDELANIYKGVCLIRELSSKTSDTIVSYGERLSSLIISKIIDGVVLYDSRNFIKTKKLPARNEVDMELTTKLIQEYFVSMPSRCLVPGFISSDKDTNVVTNLGRGGSDYTASLLAAVLNAEILEIWTDVDGFLTADPRVISTAYVIEKLSYVEAMELSTFGAKVIYPPTIYPAYHKNIPVRIKNTFNPDAPGTYISRERVDAKEKAIKGISSINDTSLITIEGLGMVGVIGINYRIFKTLAEVGISVFLVSQAASENTISIGVKSADTDLAMEVLYNEFKREIDQGELNGIKAERDLATVAIVGENMKHTTGIAGKLFDVLGRNGINVIACAQGASETNISFVIDHKNLRKALNVIHDSFFLSEYQALNVFLVGTGTVGGSLLDQICMQQSLLMKQNSLKLKVVGIADDRKMLLDRRGINLTNYREELEKNGKPSNPDLIKKEILEMNIFNSVFVDCTASPAIAALYKDMLSNNISVVAANKIASSSEYDQYVELKNIARKRGVKYLFETNVGAGLPIINTMNNLINSGDRILKLEAVLSGTLNFIFNTISADIPLSKAILLAKEARYSEPDPRIDLSGKDVIRKLVILARESGYAINQEDVIKNFFIPDKYFEGSLEDFWNNIPEMDEEFEAKRQILEAEDKHWRFVAKLENGIAEVGLQAVDSRHPFYDLEGSNNIIMITTERYLDYPMIIKGYGAGASVTSAGVFADIISIANIR